MRRTAPNNHAWILLGTAWLKARDTTSVPDGEVVPTRPVALSGDAYRLQNTLLDRRGAEDRPATTHPQGPSRRIGEKLGWR